METAGGWCRSGRGVGAWAGGGAAAVGTGAGPEVGMGPTIGNGRMLQRQAHGAQRSGHQMPVRFGHRHALAAVRHETVSVRAMEHLSDCATQVTTATGQAELPTRVWRIMGTKGHRVSPVIPTHYTPTHSRQPIPAHTTANGPAAATEAATPATAAASAPSASGTERGHLPGEPDRRATAPLHS